MRATYPFDGHPGLSVRFTYYPAEYDGWDGDGVRVAIVRDRDGAIMSSSHTDADAFRLELGSEAWQSKYAAFLDRLRLAGLTPNPTAKDVNN